MTHESLLLLISHRDPDAMTHIYNAYGRSLYSIIRTFIDDPARADDVFQETLIRAWRKIDTYNERNGRLYGWLAGIARSTALEASGKHDPSRANFIRYADSEIGMSSSVGIREFTRRMRPKCVQMLNLLFYHGYNDRQAADKLEITPETVRIQNRECVNDIRNYLR